MAVNMSKADLVTDGFETMINGEDAPQTPDAGFLEELGLEFATTEKPGETVAEGRDDAADEVAGDPEDAASEDVEAKEEEKPEEDEKPKEEPKGRANKRIQSLVAEKKVVESQLANQRKEFESQLAQERQRVEAQFQAQMQTIQKQNELLARQMALLNESKASEDDSKLTPAEKWEKELMSKAAAQALARLTPELEELKRERQAEKQAQVAAKQAALQKQKLKAYEAEATKAGREILLSDVDGASLAPEDYETASDVVLAMVAATGMSPDEAARKFKGFFDKYHGARLKQVTKTSGSKIKSAQGIPIPMSASKGTTQAEVKPSWDALKKNGYSNYIEWMRHGSPPLTKK
jgi:hypothetical protein